LQALVIELYDISLKSWFLDKNRVSFSLGYYPLRRENFNVLRNTGDHEKYTFFIAGMKTEDWVKAL